MSITLTIDQLRKAGACRRVLDKLQATYGDKRSFRKPETLARALAESGETDWFVANMLHASLWGEYTHQITPLRDEYLRQRAFLRAEFDCQTAPFRDEYLRQCASLRYERQYDLIWAEYDRQITPFWKEYLRQIALPRDKFERQNAYVAATLYFQQESPQ